METKEEAIARRRKEFLKQKKERVRNLRTMKRVSRASATLITNDEQKYKLPVMVGNYAQPGVISYPSTKEKYLLANSTCLRSWRLMFRLVTKAECK